MMTQNRPGPSDYAPFYAKYIALVPDGDLLATLANGGEEWKLLLGGLTPGQADFRYEPAKWSIKESIGHVTDTERIFTYRALRIARGDQTPLSGFEQDDYVKEGNFSGRTLEDLLEEFSAVRHSTVTLLRSLPPKVWMRRGKANQNEVTVTALAFIIAGHERHHRNILEERYLQALPRE
jgi:DinB superfamily